MWGVPFKCGALVLKCGALLNFYFKMWGVMWGFLLKCGACFIILYKYNNNLYII